MAASNGHLPNNYEEGEDKPMLIVKKSGDGPGITALINRQLQGKSSLLSRFIIWNYSKNVHHQYLIYSMGENV